MDFLTYLTKLYQFSHLICNGKKTKHRIRQINFLDTSFTKNKIET